MHFIQLFCPFPTASWNGPSHMSSRRWATPVKQGKIVWKNMLDQNTIITNSLGVFSHSYHKVIPLPPRATFTPSIIPNHWMSCTCYPLASAINTVLAMWCSSNSFYAFNHHNTLWSTLLSNSHNTLHNFLSESATTAVSSAIRSWFIMIFLPFAALMQKSWHLSQSQHPHTY